jgi:hypothetical protein
VRRHQPATFLGAAAALLALAAPPAQAGIIPLPAGMPPRLDRAAGEIAAGPEGRATTDPIPSFALGAGGGYRVRVGRVGDSVAVVVARRDHKSETAYIARGLVSSRRLKASFGRLGEIDMRFHPNRGGSGRAGGSCSDGYAIRRGTFAGRFRFAGEGSYVKLRVRRTAGKVSSPAKRCAPRRRRHRAAAHRGAAASTIFYPASPFPRELRADWRDGVDAAEFVAVGAKKRTFFLAHAEEVHGGVATLRIVFATAPTKGLRINTPLTSASVSPPPPFHGGARFHAGPDGKVTWDGPLSVNFLGLPRYPLAGERYRASAWRSY